jgi:hypothetical protein
MFGSMWMTAFKLDDWQKLLQVRNQTDRYLDTAVARAEVELAVQGTVTCHTIIQILIHPRSLQHW